MRKKIATLLTGCLLLQSLTGFVVPAHMASARTAKAGILSEVKKATDANTGNLEIEVRPFIEYTGKVAVEFNGETKELDFASKSASLAARFKNVKAGEGTVTVKADKFATYTQNVTVEAGWSHKLLVCATKVDTGSPETNPGWMQAGDVNGDGKLSEADTSSLLNSIRESTSNKGFDLNNDGKIDIADLQLTVQNLGEAPQQSLVEKLWIYNDVIPVGGTSGDVSGLASGKGAKLTPADNADISESNPVNLQFNLTDGSAGAPGIGGMKILSPFIDENGETISDIESGEVIVEEENGTKIPISLSNQAGTNTRKASAKLLKASARAATVKTESDGSLVLDFGGQIAVKRVTIRINGVRKADKKLADIAKVEFVNDMEKRIPEPKLDIPSMSEPRPGNEQLDVSWTPQNNVTGYELYVKGPAGKSEETLEGTIKVPGNKYTVSSINNESLINFETYTLKVRSVNGGWKSPWSKEITGKPEPQDKPDPPDNLKLTGGRDSINAVWKDMDDSSGYMVYYKKSSEPDSKFQPAVTGFVPDEKTGGTGMITTNSFKIAGLAEDTEYTVYVTGWNQLGWGKPSLKSLCKTKNSNPPQLPAYKLLNTSKGEGVVSAHILSAAYGGHGSAKMIDSPLDTEAKSALGVVDNNYNSYWVKNDWDDGVAYPANDRGINITLDANYKMNFMAFAAYEEAAPLEYARIDYWNSNENKQNTIGARLIKKFDVNEHQFYIVKFDNAITANKIRLCVGRSYTRAEMRIGEIRFYNYDSLEDDIMGLYSDEMHSTLKSDVTLSTIEALEKRLEKPDSESGEKHPLYSELKLELKTAKDILNDNPSPSYEVINTITSKKDGHLGFGGLNPWQPLGKTVYKGETLVVYVGHNTKRTGDSTNLDLIMTQYHAESNSLSKSSSALKIGRNEITVPEVASVDCEHGGQLYVAYNGNSTADKYAVRVLGGSDIPVLNLYKKTGAERTSAIRAYVDSLETYAANIEAKHAELHKGKAKPVDYDYDKTNCILNATDIMMEKMMYSLPATQVWSPLSSKDDKVAALDASLKAMEDTMSLFYQHKGLSNDAGTVKGNNALPSQHLNIRYMRMFAGAFMYASGNHIGIEFGSTGLASGSAGMSSLGWGIAHEIGHDINQGTYAVAEITNNYFAQLLTGKERYKLEDVYKKVTSGTVGKASNVFTQLALYWQLHLAYDDQKDDHYTYDNYEDQFNNLFFGRIDTYSRNPDKAPQAGLKLDGGADQNLMRLSCAAANKNILPFFERWGIVPDAATTAYAAKYGSPDTKALYYVNKDARDYRVDHPGEAGTIKDRNVITAATASAVSNKVEVSIETNEDTSLILGYEIIRSMTSNGVTESQVVGFQPVNTAGSTTVFTDTISTVNNRVMSYKVKAVDKFLNYSNEAEAGQVKIQTEGILDKSLWTVETNMVSDEDIEIKTGEDDPDSGYNEKNPGSVAAKTEHTIDRIIDNNAATIYTGKAPETGTAEITIDMHDTKEATSLKYSGTALTNAEISASTDGSTWETVSTWSKTTQSGSSTMVWFDAVEEGQRKSWIGTYDARYIKLTITGINEISINEIEICGPTGDNIEFLASDNGTPSIGILNADFKYGDNAKDIIPAGSLIFTGTYKGNPAYNIVMLYDTEGNVIGAKDGKTNAGQVILADVPADGKLGETSDGIWVYYVEPGQFDAAALAGTGVHGELYRVDNASTLEGERITSDTLAIQIPAELPPITLTGNTVQEGGKP
ncbi:MAG: M60 family metallopeptidase [Lachnospiraceae bacterium]